jgi:nitrile hydratase subunit beta
MTRINDVGGLTGFGPVGDRDEPSPFPHEWNRMICGLVMAYSATGRATEATIRDAVDRMAPADYLSASPWERWAVGLTAIAVEQGVITADELVALAGGPVPLSIPPESLPRDHEVFRSDAARELSLESGARVRVREWHPHGHTRCPRYAQGRTGVVVRRNAPHALPDLEVATGEHRLEPTYCVRFTARELWGEGAGDNESVHLDLYASYLVEAE